MPTRPVVESLDIVENRCRQPLPCRPIPAIEQFGLQGRKEALGCGVVRASPTVPMDPCRPTASSRFVKATDVYCKP